METLFTSLHPDISPTEAVESLKGVIIGAGQVGMACAYSMLIQNTLDELVITDINQEKLEGEVMDLVHGMSFVEPTAVKAGSLADCQDADVVVITAGVAQRPGETRLVLVQRNVEIFRSIIPEVVNHAPNAIILVVTNPVDIMAYVTWKLSGLPSARVIGSGTVLDTGRFRYLLSQELHVDPRSLHAYIVGEHGDTELPVWSKVNVSGTFLQEFNPALGKPDDPLRFDRIFDQVKNAAYEIIKRKGATSYAIGLATTQIVQALLRNQNRVLTVSHLMQGHYDLQDIYLGFPAVVNRRGIDRVVNISLSPEEQQQLQQSAQTLRQILNELSLS